MSFKSELGKAKDRIEHPFGGAKKYAPENARPEPTTTDDRNKVEPGKPTEPGDAAKTAETSNVVNVDPKTGQGAPVNQ